MQTARGAAKNTPAIKDYLDSCEAVEQYDDQTEGLITFTFDPSKQPTDGIPDGVFFDLSEAPF